LTHNGFDGKLISDNPDLKTDGNKNDNLKDLGKVELVGKDLGGKEAVSVEAPSVASTADRFSFFNGTTISGPFGIGLILDSTLRIGRCDYAVSEQDKCLINGAGLTVDTSGVGFKQDLVNAWESVTKSGQNIAEAALSKMDINKMKSNYLDINSNDFATGKFAQGDVLVNSVLTRQYVARNATTCNNSACTISTYSAFDKYFNAWMTTDLVVFNMGPTLLHKANKLLTSAYKIFGGDTVVKPKYGLDIPQRIAEKLNALKSPMSLFGKQRASRFKALVQEEGFANIIDEPLLIKPNLWSTDAAGEVGKILGPDSPIWKFPPEKRKKFFESVELLRYYSMGSARGMDAVGEELKTALKAAEAITDPAAKAAAIASAKTASARKVAANLDDWDSVLGLDYEKWLKGNDDIFSMGGYAVKQQGFPTEQGYVDIATGQPFNLKKIVTEFSENGDWSSMAGKGSGSFELAEDGVSLQLFKIQPTRTVAENVGLTDLRSHLAKMGPQTYSVRLPDGKYLPLNDSTISYIEGNPMIGGALTIFESEYSKAIKLTPEDFTNRLLHPRPRSRPKKALQNMDTIYSSLLKNDYAPRTYTSLLDQQFANEGDMLLKYYKEPLTGLYKGTVLPIVYWNAKKAFGNEDYSAFMLPDTWTTLTVSQSSDKIYGDSFIDFFVNAGSDQGDMFKRAFQNGLLFWNKAIELAISTNTFVKENVSKYSGGWFEGSGTRDTVNDVAFYSHNENCSGCVVPLSYDNEYFTLKGFNAGTNLQAFLVEASDEAQKSKEGSLLVSYTHHSNLSGKSSQIEGGKIDVSQGRRTGETCDQKLREFNLGWAGPAAGGVVAMGENIAYFFGFGPGLIASLLTQMTVGRQLQDCVDDVEGYYVHFFAPPVKESSKSKSKEIISNEKVSEVFSDMSARLDAVVKEDSKNKTVPINPVEKSMDSLKNQFEEFADKAKKNSLLQANVELIAPSAGTVEGKDVFYIWFKENLMPSAYRDKGVSYIIDGNTIIEKNLEEGVLRINGKEVLGKDKEDHVRLISQDNRIPAEVVPVTINKISSPQSNAIVFELNSFGEIKVLESSVLDCIRRAVKEQTGISYAGDELTQVFGEMKQLSTELYGNVFARDSKIYLEGKAPRAQGGSSSKFTVDGFWNSKLIADANNSVDAGKFVGMTFEHGSIILKPETQELIIWIRQHKDSVLTNKDVKDLKANLSSLKDPNSECEVPAIDLEAIPYANDDLGIRKTSMFNDSMDTLGPFTQFTSDKRIYEFYAVRDANTGECKNFFRVRDKDTGKILVDKEINGPITQDADGTLRFRTADGQEHTLKFDAENGVPKVTYNGGVPETLLSAQGTNGSFWYDPDKGLWYPENGLQIPLNQAFKENGAWFAPDENGNIVGTPENKMTFNIGQQGSSGFNIPSLPENLVGLMLFITAFLLIAFTLTHSFKR